MYLRTALRGAGFNSGKSEIIRALNLSI